MQDQKEKPQVKRCSGTEYHDSNCGGTCGTMDAFPLQDQCAQPPYKTGMRLQNTKSKCTCGMLPDGSKEKWCDEHVPQQGQPPQPEVPEWEKYAILFHNTYERLAPEYGYQTREGTKVFDRESKNGKLMIAVMEEVIPQLLSTEREKWEKKGRKEAWKELSSVKPRISHGIQCEEGKRPCGLATTDPLADRCEQYPVTLSDLTAKAKAIGLTE